MNSLLAPLPPCRVDYSLRHGALIEDSDSTPLQRNARVYEVLRVHAGVPIFLDEHINRMRNSASLSKLSFPNESSWIAPLLSLCKMQHGTQNIQLMLLEDGTLEAHFIKSSYPSEEMVRAGVEVGVIEGTRPCPHAKRAGLAIRDEADRTLKNSHLFEVLLRNHAGAITEGSRSNVLFIQQNKLVTPPLDDILPGITLAKVKEVASKLSLTVTEREVPSNTLHSFTAAAILGTSPNVLPIRTIILDEEAIPFDVNNETLQRIRVGYNALMASAFQR